MTLIFELTKKRLILIITLIFSIGVISELSGGIFFPQGVAVSIATVLLDIYSFVLLRTVIPKRFQWISYIPVLFAIGDSFYDVSTFVLTNKFVNKWECLLYIIPYLSAMAMIFYAQVSYIRITSSKDIRLSAIIASVFLAIMSFKLIVIPAFQMSPPLHPVLKVLTVIYTLLECSIIGNAIVILTTSYSIHLQIFLFGALYSHLSDTAIRYQSVDKSTMGMTFFENGWSFGFFLVSVGATLAWTELKAYKQDRLYAWWINEIRQFAPSRSIRWFFTSITFLSIVLLWILTNWSVLIHGLAPEVALNLLKILIIYSGVILATNFVSLKLSRLSYEINRYGSISLEGSKRDEFYEVENIYKGFEKLYRELKSERDAVLGMASDVSHDLETNISLIKIVRKELETIQNQDDLVANKINESVDDLAGIAKELFDLRQGVLTKRKRILDLIPIHETVSKVAELYNSNPFSKKVETESVGLAREIKIMDFRRHLINIINNGMDASTHNNLPIKIKLTYTNESIVLTVRDFGYGISNSQISRIENKQSSSTKENGNGIGVIQAIQWAEKNNFSMKLERVDDIVHPGTCVTLEIPI